jgi:hypothetical protein
MSAPSIQTAERTSADAPDGTPIGATVCRLVLPDDLTADAAGRNGAPAQAAAKAAIGEAVGAYLDAALTAGTLTL